MSIPKPVYVRKLFDGKVTLIVFGAPFNWNYAGTSREDMEAKNPGITAALEEVMREYGIKCALVPKPAFNAKVVTDADLPNELLPNFFRGADADGVILEKPGDAYLLASADCLATAIWDPRMGILAALHCGRDALVDRNRLNKSEGAKRTDESVIGTAMKMLDSAMRAKLQGDGSEAPNEMGWLTGSDEQNESQINDHNLLRAFLAAGIRPEEFDHPTVDHAYAVPNKAMIDYLELYEARSDIRRMNRLQSNALLPKIVTDLKEGKIDLFALVCRQFDEHNVEQIEEDEFDTATSKDAAGNFLFHSNRRDKNLRNLVIVKLN